MIVDVAKIVFVSLGESGKLSNSAHQAGESVTLRRQDLAHLDESSLHLENLLELLVAGAQEDRVLEVVDAVVERGETRKETIDQAVDHAVQQQRWLFDRSFVLFVAPADLRQDRK